MTDGKAVPRVVLGTMTFGKQVDEATADKMVGAFLDAGHNELDTAYMYCEGKTEEILGNILSAERREKLIVATKANPWAEGGLSPEGVVMQCETSLKRMKMECVDILYLHAPDVDTPIKTTLETCDKLFRQGKFKELALSNYAAWHVADIVHLCKREGWPVPTLHQGMYNGVTRDVERELFPCLRYFDHRFYAYNPLAGGMLTGKHKSVDSMPDSGRFHNNEMYQSRYWKESYFNALEEVRQACEKDGVTMAEAALRWISHHSLMAGYSNDAIIIGASSMDHLEANMAACVAGPLNESIVSAMNAAWEVARPDCPKYFRP